MNARYWLGWLAMAVARAIHHPDPIPELRRDLARFMRSGVPSAELCAQLREEMKRR